MASPINRALYAGFDFSTHFDELTARVQAKFAASFNDFALSSLGVLLMDMVSFGLDTMSFYLDRRTTETYLATARTRRAVSRITRQLGYKMGAATAASVDLQVSLTQAYVFSVPIPKGFQFLGPSESVYEVAQEVTFLPGETGPKTVPCYQGVTLSETFTGSGLPNQAYELRKLADDAFVVRGYTSVIVDGTPYTEQDFLDITTTPQYELAYNDDPPLLRFGDGIAGVAPANGATIAVTYVGSKGKAGQAPKGSAFEVVTPLVVLFTTIPLVIANPDGSVGGDDPESLEHAKSFAPRVWRSLKVAVTEGDYDALAGSYADPLFGRVATAKAVAAHKADDDLRLKELLNLIRAEVFPIEAGVTTQVSTVGVPALDSTDAALAASTALVGDVAAENDALASNLAGAVDLTRQSKNLQLDVVADATDMVADAASLNAQITGIAVGVADTLTALTQTALLDLVGRLQGQGNEVLSAANSTIAGLQSVLAQLQQAEDRVVAMGTPPLTVAVTSPQALGRLQAQVNAALAGSASARGAFTAVQALVVGLTTDVETLAGLVFDHVDKILSADCKANLVSVPILARDASGFYAPPSVGLIQSLQAFLDDRKEKTQVVSVVSGEQFLVPAAIEVAAGVLPGYSLSVTGASLEAAVDSVLRGRAFGASLFVSEFWDPLQEVRGVSYWNVKILGELVGNTVDASNVDAQGNLIVASTKVVTRGSVTVTTKVVTLWLPASYA